jgi:hypothetical protein
MPIVNPVASWYQMKPAGSAGRRAPGECAGLGGVLEAALGRSDARCPGDGEE